MNEFCTISDVRFLPLVLALHQSLQEVCSSFTLRVFCLDDVALGLLRRTEPENCVPIDFGRVEEHDPALLAVKADRTRSEYCWTATPALCRYVLDTEPSLETVTYLDADLMFFADPGLVLRELEGHSVLLFPQRIAAREAGWSAGIAGDGGAGRLTEIYGKYNAGSISFRNDARGRAALEWWRERCLEWCYDRLEPGRWADQRYLDDMHAMFDGVRAATHVGAALAPWNAHSHGLERRDGRVLVDGEPAVFHHYSSLHLRRAKPPVRWLKWPPNVRPLRAANDGVAARHAAWYKLSRAEDELLWRPYLERLDHWTASMARLLPGFTSRLPGLRLRDLAADLAHVSWLAAYHLAGEVLPPRMRTALSRARASGPAQQLARAFQR